MVMKHFNNLYDDYIVTCFLFYKGQGEFFISKILKFSKNFDINGSKK